MAQGLPILMATRPPLVHARTHALPGNGWTFGVAIRLWR